MEVQDFDYTKIIDECERKIDSMVQRGTWQDHKRVLGVFEVYYKALFAQIHDILVPIKTEESEQKIRELINRNVIGWYDRQSGHCYLGSINLIKSKIVKNKDDTTFKRAYAGRFIDIYNKFLSLASFRSFKHFCFYMQAVFGITLWEDNVRAFSGYWHYAQKMVLDGEVAFLEKQLPTGTGKSLSDGFMQAWIFGINPDADILKVCGNDKFTDDCFLNVIKLMTNKRYAECFPYYAKFKRSQDLMFTACSVKELKFTISGSTRATSLRIVTKLSETSGVRAKYLFIDDICQSDDTPTEMDKDKDKFRKEWFRRNYCLEDFYIIASGTSYSIFDILSYLKEQNNYANAEISPINEFTKISTSNYIRENGLCVFVTVPALDENDQSVFPKIRSTSTLRNMREEDYSTFMAMEQQTPLPPEGTPFYYENLRQYDILPLIGEYERTDCCYCALDPKRRGRDFVSMPIFFSARDEDNMEVFYLVDWYYEDKPMQDCIPRIVDYLEKHNVRRMIAERNTDECIAKLISDELKNRGITGCVVDDVYSVEPKDKRIMNSEGNIKSRIIFPRYGMFSPSSMVGKALNNVYAYTYKGSVVHDDAPDSLALFEKHFISGRRARIAKMEVLSRRMA